MAHTIKKLAVALLLLVSQFVYADSTADLWTALKAANYPNALTAISGGADVLTPDPAFGSALNFASCWADANVVKALIDAKSDVNFVSPVNGYTPLMNAATWGNIEAVKLLLAAGADIKARGKLGQTMLSSAIGSSKLEVVKLIVAAGADPNEKFTLGTITDMTIFNSLIGVYAPKDKIENIKSIGVNLSKAGVSFPDRLNNAKETDFTPLEDFTRYLLEKGADPNMKVIGTWGCIFNQAVDHNKIGIVKALIDAKADKSVRIMVRGNLAGYNATALMIASLKGYNEIVEMLCKAGVAVNVVVTQEKMELTSSTADSRTFTTFKETNTALSLAIDAEHLDTAEILRKYGALGPKELED